MDPRLNYPGPSSDDSASQAEYCPGNIQSGGWEEVQNIGGPSSHSSYLPVLYGELYRLECVWP